jgi:hypothetical protein
VLHSSTTTRVPTLRLDTFLRWFGLNQIDFLKIDAQGADLAVVRSLGNHLRAVRKLELEVQVTPQELYAGSGTRAQVLAHLQQHGFKLCASAKQSHDQEENLSFERVD